MDGEVWGLRKKKEVKDPKQVVTDHFSKLD